MVAQGLEQAAAPCGIHPVDVICVIDRVEMARHTGRTPSLPEASVSQTGGFSRFLPA